MASLHIRYVNQTLFKIVVRLISFITWFMLFLKFRVWCCIFYFVFWLNLRVCFDFFPLIFVVVLSNLMFDWRLSCCFSWFNFFFVNYWIQIQSMEFYDFRVGFAFYLVGIVIILFLLNFGMSFQYSCSFDIIDVYFNFWCS